MTSSNSSPDKLTDTLNRHVGELYDACALLDAAEERIGSATPDVSDSDGGLAHETMHNTMRIVRMARERVKATADRLFELEV